MLEECIALGGEVRCSGNDICNQKGEEQEKEMGTSVDEQEDGNCIEGN